ncbi:MAG: tetratricopeptide repeat protein, partial [Promethearchaeota archaeon]
MRISIHPELERVWKIYNEGKVEEALQLLIDFEKLGDLTLEDKHYYRFLIGLIFLQMGRFQECLKIAEQDYHENKNQNKHLFLIDSILVKFSSLQSIGGPDSPMRVDNPNSKIWEDVSLGEKLLESITQEHPDEFKLRKGFLFIMKGFFFYWRGNLDRAIELFKKSLAISENYDVFGFESKRFSLYLLGFFYGLKGELDLALDLHKKSLDLFKGSTRQINMTKGVTYNSIGQIYFQKGVLDQAISSFEKSLKLMEQNPDRNSIFWSGKSYDSLIKVLLYNNSLEKAQECLVNFSQYLEKNKTSILNIWQKIPENFYLYKVSKARILASSSRARDTAKAEEILRQLLEEKPDDIDGLMILCELYFQEFKTSKNLEILDDIQPLVDKLIKAAEYSNSFSLRAHAFLLNGIISLIRLNMGDARRYLMEAQQIADSNGLQLLARATSHQHDRLLEQIEGFESYKKKMTLPERINLASLDDMLDLMQGRKAVNAPDLINEEPVLLLILAGGGFLLFSYPFSDEVKVEDELFGGFLSAITSFSDEALSEGLDRAKFGLYTVLMKNIADFYFCYLFKGQTYLAQKKFSDFIENFQTNDSMMQTLDKFNRTSQVIDLKDFPFFEGFIKQT